MNQKSEINQGTNEIECPYCHSKVPISTEYLDITCKYCNRIINPKSIPNHSELFKRNDLKNKKKIICFKCENEIWVDINAQAVMCKHCYSRNDLSNHKVKTIFGTVLQTHGELYLVKRGLIETSVIQAGSAIIKGKINGNITINGAVEIFKTGIVNGNITCKSIIIRKGGIFIGQLQILKPEINQMLHEKGLSLLRSHKAALKGGHFFGRFPEKFDTTALKYSGKSQNPPQKNRSQSMKPFRITSN